MKRFLSLISAVIFMMATALPALAQNSTAASPAKNKAAASSAMNQGKSEPKTAAVEHHASGKAEHDKSKQEKKA